jgi:hypothetical protein
VTAARVRARNPLLIFAGATVLGLAACAAALAWKLHRIEHVWSGTD